MSVILQVVEASAALMYTIDFVIFTFQCGVSRAVAHQEKWIAYFKEGVLLLTGDEGGVIQGCNSFRVKIGVNGVSSMSQ